MLGRYALALAVTAPVFMFTNMRLRFVVATDVAGRASFAKYFRFRVLSSVLGMLLVVVGIAIILRAPELVYMMLVISMLRVIESFSDVVYGLYQRYDKLHLMALSMVLAGIGMLVATLIALNLNMRVEVVLLAMLSARLAVFFFFDLIQWYRRWRPGDAELPDSEVDDGRVLSIFSRCWPLGLVALLVSLNTNIPRYFIDYLLGSEFLGIFAALAYVPIAGYMIVGTIGQTMMPQIARAFGDQNVTAVARGALFLYGFGAVAGIGAIGFGVIFGSEFLRLAYGESFAVYDDLFVILLSAGAISYVVVGAVYVLTASGYFKSQLLVYATDLVVVALLCAVLVPRIGVNGSGFAMLTSQVAQAIIAVSLTWIVIQRLKDSSGRPQRDPVNAI